MLAGTGAAAVLNHKGPPGQKPHEGDSDFRALILVRGLIAPPKKVC